MNMWLAASAVFISRRRSAIRACAALLELEQRVGQRFGVAAASGAGVVGLEFPLTADGHLDQHGDKGGDDRHDQGSGEVSGAAAFTVAAAMPPRGRP